MRGGEAGDRLVWAALAVLGAAAGIAGMWIPVESRGSIPFPCAFLKLTGWPCLFCGMTRAFLAMGHGMWAEAFRQSPAGAMLYPAAWGVAIYSAIQFARGARAAITIPRWAWMAGACALAANWIYRVAMGFR